MYAFDQPAKINFQPVIDASLILKVEIEEEIKTKKKKQKQLAGHIFNKRAVTALHGTFPLGTQGKVITRNGSILYGNVEFERFEENMVDIAVILLNDEFEFAHFVEWSNEPVELLQPIVVVGLKYGSAGDAVFPYARLTAVEMVEEFGEASVLFFFQASYFCCDGCSYRLVCEIARVPDLIQLLSNHV